MVIGHLAMLSQKSNKSIILTLTERTLTIRTIVNERKNFDTEEAGLFLKFLIF
jgi:hypothetical protein